MEFLENEDMLKIGRIRSLAKFIRVRWLSFIWYDEKIVKLYDPILNALEMLRLFRLRSDLVKVYPLLVFLNDLAPYYRTLIYRDQELNLSWGHKAYGYILQFFLLLYTNIFSRDTEGNLLVGTTFYQWSATRFDDACQRPEGHCNSR